jgi:glutamine kinase
VTINFGTKAATLKALDGLLKHSLLCECYVFTVGEWRITEEKIIGAIQSKFAPARIIVRSSALNEDGEANSMAGAYLSVKDVDSASAHAIMAAVREVISSYGAGESDANEILVQPMITDVSMSGVVFSHDLNTGAPYYVVNYDDETGRTDTVTSGTDTSRTLLIHRNHVDSLQSPRFRALIRSVQEIEALVASPGVDVEFAVTKEEKIFIFQARRIAVSQNWNRNIVQHLGASLSEIHRFLKGRFRPTLGTLGATTLFGEMPDWNPAEMIGAVPRPLAQSLYECLITNSVWAEARAEMTYRDLTGRPLMVSLGGRVYVDVRESFNSFLPATLPDEIAEKLVSAWVARLKAHPELHDKIEFEVAVTAYTLDFEDRVACIRNTLSTNEREAFRSHLSELTNNIIAGTAGSVALQELRITGLDERRRQLMQGSRDSNQLEIVRDLLRDCANNGTRAFSIMARRAFIAEALLRSIQAHNILSAATVEAFRISVPTVLSEFLTLLHRCQKGELEWSRFMDTYGHLRPGTYDILARRYDQHEGLDCMKFPDSVPAHRPQHAFSPTREELTTLDRALASAGFVVDSSALFEFMRVSIAGREYAKLVFTRNVSDALELIAQWGEANGLSREELSYLTISQLLESTTHSYHEPVETYYRTIAKVARERYEVSQALRLPYLISSLSDIYIVPLLKSRANFVTSKRVQAPLHYLPDHVLQSPRCAGKVVLIERADPGYDWIFMSPIAGLVTKYGGSNSHMAIRCAEFEIPAAIGCGEQVFEQLRTSAAVMLDCAAGLLVPIR